MRELVALKVPRGDSFLLFGPIDILIEFRGVTDLEEYIERWLTPISRIGEGEKLVTDTLTLIVGKEGRLVREIPFAVIFLSVQPQQFETVRRGIQSVPEVLSADLVFGPYDIICPVRAKNMADLEQVVLSVQTRVSGIERTLTCLVKAVY
jgi:hypothetical protein